MSNSVNEPMDTTPNKHDLKDVKKLVNNGYKTASIGIRTANALPSEGNWNFYKLNDSFSRIMRDESNRLQTVMNKILKRYDIRDNIRGRDIGEKGELVVEANDAILERIGDNIDEMNGIKKKNVNPVEVKTVVAQVPINGSWNRINRATFSVSSSMNSPAEKTNSSVAIHLLTGNNIIRPQSFFKDKIDNSNNYPWQPRITDKPNSVRPLALFIEGTEFGESFCHPYETELNQFQPSAEELKKIQPSAPKPVKDTPLFEITTAEELNDLVEELRNHQIIAVDLEHHSYRSFMGITCLMQISTTKADYLLDALKLRDKLHVLNEIFTKPSIVKVFHGADSDIQWLQRDLSLYVVNMFDTHQAAKQLGYSGLSLAYLLQRFCKFLPNKQFQLADWRIRPLPDALKNYAREDTHFLIYIYQMLRNELLKQGNGMDNILRSVIQQSTEICKKRYFKPILRDDSHLDFYHKCKRFFDNRQMYALRGLYQWRDKIAREEDESTGYVLPNHMLLQIAERLPKEMQGILACCNPIPPLVRANLLDLHQVVLKARDQSAEKPIMKEDNRGSGSTQQFSKINIESPLHCPHDLTKHSEFRDDLPVLLYRKQTTDLLYAKEELQLEMKKSKYSVFNTLETSDDEDVNMDTLNWKILTPFERYKLVKPYAQSEQKKENDKNEKDQERDSKTKVENS